MHVYSKPRRRTQQYFFLIIITRLDFLNSLNSVSNCEDFLKNKQLVQNLFNFISEFDTSTDHNFETRNHDVLKIGSFVGKYELSSLKKLFPNCKDGSKMARLTLFMLQLNFFQLDFKSNDHEGKTDKAVLLIGERLL